MKLIKRVSTFNTGVDKNGNTITVDYKATVILGVTVKSSKVTTWTGKPIVIKF